LFGARPFWLPNTLGARYLNYLLREPNDPIDPFALEVIIKPEKGLARAKDSIQEGSDRRARRAYREELSRLRAGRSSVRERRIPSRFLVAHVPARNSQPSTLNPQA
jgi:hypothetical protein